MTRQLTPQSSLDNLKREAKRWLKALRAGDPDARARLQRALSTVSPEPSLRDVQHALAREHGFPGWTALTSALEDLLATAEGTNARDAAITALLAAAGKGDAAHVADVLDKHPDIINERGTLVGHTGLRTALHFGVRHADVVAELLTRGADPNIRDEGDDAMPLHFAAEQGRLDIVKLLIEHGADPVGDGTMHELNALGWATCFAEVHRDVAEYLLAHGARHTIHTAVALGDVDEIREIASRSRVELERPMDRTNHRRRPLHLAVVKKRPESLATLLDLGADTEAFDVAGLSPLDQAALDGQPELVRLLIDHGAELRLPSALALGRTDDIERVLRDDPDALKPSNRFERLIVRAAERGSANVIETLIRYGASVDVRDDPDSSVDQTGSYTALHAAAFYGNADAVAVLLKHGANPNLRDTRYCATPAGWAEYAGHTAIRDRILEEHVDPFQAIQFERPENIASIVQRDPWQLNKRFSQYATCEARPDQRYPEPWQTPLAWAVTSGKINAVRALLAQGADLIVAPDGRRLREIAAASGHDEIARLLTDHERVLETQAGRLRLFFKNACPDHDIRGVSAHVTAINTAERLFRHHPEIADEGFYSAVVCGNVARVERDLRANPALATERGGPKNWEPLLYLCFTRLRIDAARENAVDIARLLLDHGADPNAYFMAGDSRYTPLVGVIGEGEESRPPHPRRDELTALLLERGAEPYDIQVFYDIHFQGDALWYLKLAYEQSVKLGRRADWDDPEWRMMDIGAYGHGARYLLSMSLHNDNVELAEWLLEHGASPNAAPPRGSRGWRAPQISIYEEAVRLGATRVAAMLLRYGAAPTAIALTDEEKLKAAAFALDRARAREIAEAHPGLLRSTKVVFEAVRSDRDDVVAFLLDLGVPLEVEDRQRTRPLHEAAYHNATKVGRLLIERGAEIDPVELHWSNTPLDFAVYARHQAMIDLLAPVSRDVGNLVFMGKVERLRELLAENPALARMKWSDGSTPLMWLPDDETRAIEIVELFRANGAELGATDSRGLTAADHAARRGMEEVARVLATIRTESETAEYG
jgi:ankyrin repeat protein